MKGRKYKQTLFLENAILSKNYQLKMLKNISRKFDIHIVQFMVPKKILNHTFDKILG